MVLVIVPHVQWEIVPIGADNDNGRVKEANKKNAVAVVDIPGVTSWLLSCVAAPSSNNRILLIRLL